MKSHIYTIIKLIYLIGFFYYFFMVMYYMIKLDRYLKKHFPDKWEYLTTVPPFGPGGANPFRGLPFMFNKKEDFGDKNVRDLKKKTNKYALATVLTIAIGGPSLMLALDWVHKMID